MKKGKAVGQVFNGLCALMGDEGKRLRNAVDAAHRALGEDGTKALDEGDFVGAAVEALRNTRKKSAPASSPAPAADRDDDGNDEDVDPF